MNLPVVSPRGQRGTSRAASVIVGGCLTAVIVTGCFTEPDSGGSDSPTAPNTPTPSASTAEVALVPGGTAEDNLPLFDKITRTVWAGPDQVAGRAYIDALVAAGFDKSAMQVTPDRSTVDNPAESILFSVKWGEQCLIGQVGPATGEPATAVADVTTDGLCLIGNTRPIDW